MVTSQLFPSLPDQPALSQKEHHYKEQMRENFDSHHHSKELPPLKVGEQVWTSENKEAEVVKPAGVRLYLVETDGTYYRRNHRQLRSLSGMINNDIAVESQSSRKSLIKSNSALAEKTPSGCGVDITIKKIITIKN